MLHKLKKFLVCHKFILLLVLSWICITELYALQSAKIQQFLTIKKSKIKQFSKKNLEVIGLFKDSVKKIVMG